MTGQPNCNACGALLTQTLVDLGSTPLANSYLTQDKLDKPELSYSLHARVCSDCRLVQVEPAVPADEIFSDYAYFSSYSASWVEHARKFTEMASDRWALGPASKVIEVASNDGYLLKHFADRNVPVLGIEPAANVAKVAIDAGIRTEVSFFGRETAERLVAAGDSADLIVCNNVLAHVPDINDFVAGLEVALKPKGVISVEFPHLLQLIKNNQFDTIYHEHYSYLSLLATQSIFARHGLRVFDITELPTHGGSLRVMACRANDQSHEDGGGLAKVQADESAANFDSDEGYKGFAPKTKSVRDALSMFLRDARQSGKTVVAYGAAAKGNTLLNTARIGTDLIDYVVDLNPHKQNHFLPGSRLPIYPPSRIAETRPDYVLILPWNLKNEISSQMAHIGNWGGQFVVAVPELETFAPSQS